MAQRFLKAIQEELQLTLLEPLKSVGGGCISESVAYKCDLGLIFVKFNSKENVRFYQISPFQSFTTQINFSV